MAIKLGVVMDPIATINRKKDSTFAMLLEAQARQYEIYYMTQADIYTAKGEVYARCQMLKVNDDDKQWFEFISEQVIALTELDVILMRKDPPFNMEYIYTTYMLELVEQHGVLVVNKPQSLRDYNEKLATAWFPQCCPDTLVTRDAKRIHAFHQQHQDIILKPLEGMGGASVFRVKMDDPNLNVIIENLTSSGQRYVMAQQFIPEISAGDKRILLIDGKPVLYALARIPKEGETRGNLAVGGTGKGIELSERDKWICSEVGPVLQAKGLLFVGLDVIGDYLTEINITSPTCIREIDSLYGLNISATLFDAIEAKI